MTTLNLKPEDIYQWYYDNIKLIQKVCWKVKNYSNCAKAITLEDLMAHCLDKIVHVVNKYEPEKGTKLSTYVTLSLRFECMRYIAKYDENSKRFPSVEKFDTKKLFNSLEYRNNEVEYIEESEFSDDIFKYLEDNLSALELRVYLLRLDELEFDEIAKIVGIGVTKVRKIFYEAFYKARKICMDKYV